MQECGKIAKRHHIPQSRIANKRSRLYLFPTLLPPFPFFTWQPAVKLALASTGPGIPQGCTRVFAGDMAGLDHGLAQEVAADQHEQRDE